MSGKYQRKDISIDCNNEQYSKLTKKYKKGKSLFMWKLFNYEVMCSR